MCVNSQTMRKEQLFGYFLHFHFIFFLVRDKAANVPLVVVGVHILGELK